MYLFYACAKKDLVILPVESWYSLGYFWPLLKVVYQWNRCNNITYSRYLREQKKS